MAVTGGPALDFKWGGMTLTPSSDGELEYDFSGFDYEHKMSPNQTVYSDGKARVGSVTQECIFTAEEFKNFKAMQDGNSRAGTITCPNGDVLSVNAAIDGEANLSNGKCKVKLAGKVKLQ